MSIINVDSISDAAGTGSPSFPNGISGNGSAMTNLTSANLTGALPAIDGSSLTSLTSANLTGALPAIDGSSLTGVTSANHISAGAVIATALSDTFIIPANTAAFVYLVGGGGSGGVAARSDSSSAGTAAAGGGGGGGAIKYLAASGSDNTLTFTIGAGGAGRNNYAQAGATGGTSTLTGTGISLTANGGAGGGYASILGTSEITASGAAGGTATGGDTNIDGGSTGDIVKTSGHGYNVGAGAMFNGGDIAANSSRNSFVTNTTYAYNHLTFAQLLISQGAYVSSGSSSGLVAESANGYIGNGSGGAVAISDDNDTGSRSGKSGNGGNGAVYIALLREVV